MIDDDFGDLDHEDEVGQEEQGKGKVLGDSLRKALVTGMSALFMTEEGIRGALSEMRLPKDALAYLAQQTDKTRRELFRAVSDEIKGFLKSIDLTGEIRKALVGLKVEVKAEVRFSEEGAPDTTISARIEEVDPRPDTDGADKPKSHD
ncbi:MAG: hypothetical protein A2289_18005 [Deltaproteobacteria bacterium RIFOXYA12_FULL_58_15]|nr:MAG: hypothetical protein A2289_18005 [Deltaproteobacteria bacterium RIFOXYA12_FULL_58_15]OGR07092.1 MAG: hypothetical protein A2341_08125 [Deltaproteobacteria bacterium RIFOXYB12_FULL_58_9]